MNWAGIGLRVIVIGLILLVALPTHLIANDKTLKGEFEWLDEPSKHEAGKVILYEFADFYCPHCHMFEQVVVTQLKNKFGEQLESRLVGFPVIQGKLSTAFEMYEQAITMGKGAEMKEVLFRSIHRDNVHVFDKAIRGLLIKEVGLDANEFEKGLASGTPFRAVEKGKQWGERIGVTHTPTVVIDGNIRVANLTVENLWMVIQSILSHDKQS